MIDIPAGVIPVRDLTTREILYGARETSHRYELLSHDPATGLDSLLGFLDGVRPGGSVRWSSAARVKKSGSLSVLDLATARGGMLRVGGINLVTTRIRPVLIIEGLPEMPLGLYVITAAPEAWADTGRTYDLELLDKSTVLDQDEVEESFTAPTGVPVLEIVQDVIESAAERITVDLTDSRELTNELVWEVGTPKLTIVNDLLEALNYNALWVDGSGNFRATPYVAPADRSIRYTMLNDETGERLVRELSDGAESIYLPDWNRDRDTYRVPNKVIAVQSGTGDDAPLVGVVTNEDPDSPFSYPSRGRWVTRTLEGVETPDGDDSSVITFLEDRAMRTLVAASAVQAAVSVSVLPIPVELLDAIIFASAPAGIDARHTVQAVELPLRFDGLMSLELQEVVAL